MAPTSPLRHRNQQGSLSAKTRHLLALYEDDLAGRVSLRTVPEYLHHLRALGQWLQARGVLLAQASSSDLLAYQSALFAMRKKDGKLYSVALQVKHLCAIKSFFRFLNRRHHVLSDASAAIEFPKAEQRLPRTILSEGEVTKLLRAAEGTTPLALRDRAILETFYATGLRASELAQLTPYDVDTEDRVVRVVQGKGRKDRYVPLTQAAARAIEEYLVRGRPQLRGRSGEGALFLATRSGRRMQREVLARLVAHYGRKARLKKRVTCHTLRHSIATQLLRRGADIRHIQALLGHASLGATERYTRVEISDLKAIISRAHPRGR